MLACWHPTPGERPTFTELKETFDGILSRNSAPDTYISFNLENNGDYYIHDSLRLVQDSSSY